MLQIVEDGVQHEHARARRDHLPEAGDTLLGRPPHRDLRGRIGNIKTPIDHTRWARAFDGRAGNAHDAANARPARTDSGSGTAAASSAGQTATPAPRAAHQRTVEATRHSRARREPTDPRFIAPSLRLPDGGRKWPRSSGPLTLQPRRPAWCWSKWVIPRAIAGVIRNASCVRQRL